ncbi:hypothetical protein GYMLUDRAFT_63597 [Collybiopsis luxurians FD-317 M1]|uniref:Unplaced genomic scaffold GYMLUscaffold_77, whole genome shotgun sequence n=1 Tax=Collybiopsis luxurians FD-317 M1 TaxID=944289 RepID=A0A0D0CFI5_9AGAR|nr:hypothetical protein GYMLUDRAFT_63597 [Collybiopsis luxurians FD-317 M1]
MSLELGFPVFKSLPPLLPSSPTCSASFLDLARSFTFDSLNSRVQASSSVSTLETVTACPMQAVNAPVTPPSPPSSTSLVAPIQNNPGETFLLQLNQILWRWLLPVHILLFLMLEYGFSSGYRESGYHLDEAGGSGSGIMVYLFCYARGGDLNAFVLRWAVRGAVRECLLMMMAVVKQVEVTVPI